MFKIAVTILGKRNTVVEIVVSNAISFTIRTIIRARGITAPIVALFGAVIRYARHHQTDLHPRIVADVELIRPIG